MERAGVTQLYTVVGQVRSFRVIGFRAKARLVLVLGDATGSVQCVWFGGVQYWKRRFSVGDLLAVSGRTSWYGNVLQFVHPDVERLSVWDDRAGSRDSGTDWVSVFGSGGFVPVYPSSKQLERVGLDSAGFRRVIGPALKEYLPSFAEVLPDSLRKSRGLEPIAAALRHAHFPLSRKELDAGLFRLKYEEFFFFQVMLALQRHRVREEAKGIAFSIRSKLARQLVDSLPFQLTRAQVRVINEITADMQTSKPLNRLLQGDVGSGKTIVALIAMLIAVENGYQACFMAPTEILAEQHHRTLTAFLRGIPVNVRLLVGGQRTRLRRDILQDVQRGSAQIVVGTHALLEQSVQFARLGLVVIDEQHRFGVVQRAALRRKGEFPDVVVMTATPIPRTLSMTLYGELDLSIIDELPKNRKPIQTVVKGENEKEWVFEFTREQVSAGRQAYYVYPLIEESEKVDLKAATKHAEYLQNDVFPELRLGLLHGRMPSAEKDSIMERFKNGEIDILVTTTVIEVGIDIPNATLMVIENAERFGLSQLHQLRGRVGRGSEQSYCILFSGFRATSHGKADSQLSLEATEEEAEAAMAKRRLATMAATNDGFKIAEVDLELRGPGDFLGTRQSGLPEFKVANLITDASILVQARKDAFDLVQRDPGLKHPEHYKLAEHVALLYRDATLFLRTA
jgi:ATP-dependent DNA helicase RecG